MISNFVLKIWKRKPKILDALPPKKQTKGYGSGGF